MPRFRFDEAGVTATLDALPDWRRDRPGLR